MKTYKVYKLTSPSDKHYIGFTSDTVGKRFSQHKQSYKQWVRSERSRTGVCTKLFYAFDTHTPETFTQELLFESTSKQEALDFEVKTIADLNTIENGYNLCIGGTSGFAGLKLTTKHRQHLSNARKAYFQTPGGIEWKKKLSERYKTNNPSYKGMTSRLGHHTEESKQKISKANKGKKRTSEQATAAATRMKKAWENGNFKNRKKADKSNIIYKTGWKQTDYQKLKVAEANRKTWIITHPDGREETVVDMKAFGIKHNLKSTNNFSSVAKGKLPHYKGFKARYA